MRIQYVLVASLALALMGQGCLGSSPAPSTEAPVEAMPAEEAMMPVDESPAMEDSMEKKDEEVVPPVPTPTPAPKVVPKPAPSPTGDAVKSKTVVVEMKDGSFSPQIVAISAGDTVVWKNVGAMNHTSRGIRNGPLVWDSGNLAPGQTYSRTFTAAGRFGYGCSIHPNMTGEVIVGDVQPSGQ
jgi:plastocyanin